MCETRWIERHESITRFKELYLSIYHGEGVTQMSFKNIFSDYEKAMLEGDIKSIILSKTAGRQTCRDNTPADSPEQYYKRTIFLPLLDHFILQLEDRFSKHHRVMSTLQSLIPKYMTQNTTYLNKLKECALFYKPLIPNFDTFDTEIKIWQTQWQNVSDDDLPKCSLTTLSQINNFIL
ncbi:unnamed protein product [Macrosiphum euphorbiae]|uniref:Uncharacterized protein n=1 Tax=Macrosiphum euphorbiae TaxID=13131 RepID=A0AAV0W720_9HEMI|nr:unnamed protein product [Macrosiphum euphorbiae]